MIAQIYAQNSSTNKLSNYVFVSYVNIGLEILGYGTEETSRLTQSLFISTSVT